MTGWRHRAVKSPQPDGTTVWDFREEYVDEHGSGYATRSCPIYGGCLEDLETTLSRFERALDRPPAKGTFRWEWRVVRYTDHLEEVYYNIRRVYFDDEESATPTWIGPAYDPPRADSLDGLRREVQARRAALSKDVIEGSTARAHST